MITKKFIMHVHMYLWLCLLLSLGDAAVGKSAITQVFHSDNSQFPKSYTMVY